MAPTARGGIGVSSIWALSLVLGLSLIMLGCEQRSPEYLNPGSPEAKALGQIYFARGLRSGARGDQGGARFYFQRAGELDRGNSAVFYQKGISYFAAGNRRFAHTRDPGQLGDAVNAYSRAIALDPKCAAAYEARGFARLAQSAVAKALDDFLVAASIDTHFVRNFSDTTYSTRDAESAVDCYKKQLEANPKLRLLWHKYGNACAAAGLIELAYTAYGEAIEMGGHFPLALLARGSLYLQFDEIESAQADLLLAVELLPKHPAAKELLARCHFRQGRFSEAYELYTESLTSRRTSSQTFIQRGLTQFELGDWQAALSDFSYAQAFAPSEPFWLTFTNQAEQVALEMAERDAGSPNPASFFLLAAERWRASEHGAALEALDQCLQLEPDFPLGWLVRGLIEEDSEHLESALSNFDQALALEPTLARALNNRGSLYARRGEIEAARRDYEAAIQAAPKFAWPHRNLGLLLSGSDPVQAIAALSCALMLDPSLTEARLDRALLYEATGNLPAAKCDRWLATSNQRPRQ